MVDGITNSMDMSLSKFWRNREAWCAVIHGIAMSWTHKEKEAAAPEAEELPREAAEKTEQGTDLMAETLKRLYDEPAEAAADAAAETVTEAEEVTETVKDAAEAVRADAESAVQDVREATRRRRNGKA